MINKAIDIAMRAHEGQTRMDGYTPYIMHPLAVMNIVTDYGYKDAEILSAAVLHDVIEDCDNNYEKEIDELSPKVMHIVMCLTCDESPDEYNAMFAGFPLEAHIIKCADIIHNVSNHPNKGKYARKKMRQLLSMNSIYYCLPIYRAAYELCKTHIEKVIYA